MGWIPSYKKPGSGGDMPTIITWSGGTDEEIVAMLQAHYDGLLDIHDYWSVGDERTISLSAMSAYSPLTDTHVAQDVTFVLTNVGGKYLSDGVTECAFQVDQKDCLKEKGYLHSTSNNIWATVCARRPWCNDTYYNSIPSTIRPIFKQFINQTGNADGGTSWASSGVVDTIDYFSLRAEIEILGTTSKSVSGEGSQVDYYKTSSNREKQINGQSSTDDYYWGRSPSYNTYNRVVCFCSSLGGTIYQNSPTWARGIAPFGVI